MLGTDAAAFIGQPVGESFEVRSGGGVPALRTGLPSTDGQVDLVFRRPDGTDVPVTATIRTGGGRIVLALRPSGERSGIAIISTVSHELRSPLTSVKGYTSLMLNRWDRLKDEQKRTMLEQVHHDADRVTRLVTELLDISRLETGRLVLRRQMVDLAAAGPLRGGEGGHGDPRPRLHRRCSRRTCPASTPTPTRWSRCSPTSWRTPPSTAAPRPCGSRARWTTGAVAVAVHDTGEGIPPEDLPRVFTKFFRRDHGRPTGTGLGLWISQGLVEAHGGHLTATSTLGEGSTFRFTLPTDAFERELGAGTDWRGPALSGEHPSSMLQDIAAIEADAAPADRGGRDPRRAAGARPGAPRQAVPAVVLQGEARRASMPTAAARSGGALNRVRDALEAALAARRAELEAVARREQLAAERLDLTEVPPDRGAGHLHLVTQAMETLEDVFIGMGFTIAEGPEVETDWHNFGALNFPPDHPARDMYDTLYVEMGEPGSTVLRTHTSPVQVRVMTGQEPPFYMVMPGRVFRQDTPDATHMPVFHQIEGLVIDRDITFADLAGTLDAFTKAFFGGDFTSRLRPSYFPFTEPSAEFDIQRPDGSWLELGGCGMVHPNVLTSCGIDPEEWQGFAFGFGLDRLGASAHGVDDLRDLFTNDIRFLESVLGTPDEGPPLLAS